VSLRCVHADADSPAHCLPGSTDCADPDRLNNPPCSELTILDSPRTLSLLQAIPYQFPLIVGFTVQNGEHDRGDAEGGDAGGRGRPPRRPPVGDAAGLPARARMPTTWTRSTPPTTPREATAYRDFNGNETLENPTSDPSDSTKDYLFETRTYGDLTVGGTRNTALHAPWNFDSDDGGFRVGLSPQSSNLAGDPAANWGEDKNFNGILDPGEDRDPVNGVLDRGWSTKGGCGWQSRGSNATGGIWHTGTIGRDHRALRGPVRAGGHPLDVGLPVGAAPHPVDPEGAPGPGCRWRSHTPREHHQLGVETRPPT
jgi:hypothetical protein